ncbi:MAG: hypothetical protein PHH00_02680 [Candidatus Nanoarchaeia archaeon]|nr:hypothetical protein [Candidatus Nanoarchaeia archaeon]
MGERIEVKVKSTDLRLVSQEWEGLNVSGSVTLSFYCPRCHLPILTTLNYHGEHPSDTMRKCDYCDEPYTVNNTISLSPHVGGRDEVETIIEMQPLVERARQSLREAGRKLGDISDFGDLEPKDIPL